MSLRINPRALAAILLLALHLSVFAQSATQSNPGEVAALTAGVAEINAQVSKQVGNRTATSAELLGMNIMTRTMKRWEKNYMDYAKSMYTFASQVIGTSDVYVAALQTFQNLRDIATSIAVNPQGPFATLGMSHIYLEVSVEFIECYELIQLAKEKSTTNMMTGSDRARLLWEVSDKLRRLNRKLRQLALSICCYTFEDVWNNATIGLLDKSHGQLAREAFRRFTTAVGNRSKVHMNM